MRLRNKLIGANIKELDTSENETTLVRMDLELAWVFLWTGLGRMMLLILEEGFERLDHIPEISHEHETFDAISVYAPQIGQKLNCGRLDRLVQEILLENNILCGGDLNGYVGGDMRGGTRGYILNEKIHCAAEVVTCL